MRSLFLVLAAILALSLPTLAGPLTGGPVIAFELGGETPTTQGVGGGLAIGYSNFTVKSVMPPITILGVTTPSSTSSASASGVTLSGEVYKVLSEKGNAVKFGAWYSAPTDAKLSEVHAGYKLNKNWGFELGQFLQDARDIWGKTSYHVTYDLQPSEEGKVAWQFGIGGMTKTTVPLGFGLGEPSLERSTTVSAYANARIGLQNDLSINVGAWYLNQKMTLPSWNLLGVAIPEISSSMSTVQWTLSVGRKF